MLPRDPLSASIVTRNSSNPQSAGQVVYPSSLSHIPLPQQLEVGVLIHLDGTALTYKLGLVLALGFKDGTELGFELGFVLPLGFKDGFVLGEDVGERLGGGTVQIGKPRELTRPVVEVSKMI